MPFIPFLNEDGSPVDVRHTMTPHQLKVAPELVEQAQMVMRNQLMELLLDHLLGKTMNDQTQYEAEQITLEYWQSLIKQGGVKW